MPVSLEHRYSDLNFRHPGKDSLIYRVQKFEQFFPRV